MKKRNMLKKKMELFYQEIQNKRKGRMRLQTDLEFQQNEIKKLNKKYDVEMFSTRLRGGKAFAAEQKIREFKKILLIIKNLSKKDKKKINVNQIIKRATTNMNKTKTVKYQIEPEEAEKRSLEIDNFREKFDFYRLEKVGKEHKRNIKCFEKKDSKNRRKLRQPLNIGEKVLVLAERLKKKDAPGRLYKSTTQNKSFFNKEKIFIIKKECKQHLMNGTIGLQKKNLKKNNKFRFIRQELYALEGQWT